MSLMLINDVASHMNQLTTGESSQLKSRLDALLLNTAVDKLHLFDAVSCSSKLLCFQLFTCCQLGATK